jgi:hypothetical protein
MLRDHRRDYERELEGLLLCTVDTTRRPARGWRYPSPGAFVLAHGEAFRPARAARYPGPPHDTWRHRHGNALQAVLLDGELSYAEGYALTRDRRVTLHAWAVDRSGRAVETTFPHARPRAYFGVVFGTGYLVGEFATEPDTVVTGATALGRYRVVEDPDAVPWRPGGSGPPVRSPDDAVAGWTAALLTHATAGRPPRRDPHPRAREWDRERGR